MAGSPPSETRNILTRTDILQGKNKRESLYIEHYKKNVIVRPLTDGELSEIFKLIGNVPLNKDGMIDFSSIDVSTNLKALRAITAMALVEPKMNEEEVAEMHFGVPGFIAKRVLELSGLSPTAGDEAKKFRGNA